MSKIYYTGALSKVYVGMVFLLLSIACKQARKVADSITKPTPRELYARQFENDSIPFILWEDTFNGAFSDSLEIELPYSEQGVFFAGNMVAYSYTLDLQRGEVFHAEIQTDSLQDVFLDLYKKTSDSLERYKFVARNELGQKIIEKVIEGTGVYTLIVQPGIEARTNFWLQLYTSPLYAFPVVGKDNGAIQSFWGADRDSGQRSHQGVDIFADRGTPVVAVTDGRISSTGNRGLGGKQVWLRSGLFGNSLYYAHLDSILVHTGKRVQTGDTLGFVGNTGNARTTVPHLHFGIYERYRGAIDPLAFIRINDSVIQKKETISFDSHTVTVSAPRANLRNSPSVQGVKIGEASKNDSLSVLGITGKWAHVKSSTGIKAYVHRSLIAFGPKNQI